MSQSLTGMEKSFIIKGSRNYVEEHVSDIIWEYPEGTEIKITINKDKVIAEVKKPIREETIQTVKES